MKIFNLKKSLAVIANWGPWMLFIVAVGMVAIIIVKIANVNVADATRIPPELEDEMVLAPRFYNSEGCFAYKDELGRVHTQVIDPHEFNQESMEKCFPESSVGYAFSLLLSAPDIFTGSSGPIHTSNWPGGYPDKEIIEDVYVVDALGKKYPGRLRIKVKNVR